MVGLGISEASTVVDLLRIGLWEESQTHRIHGTNAIFTQSFPLIHVAIFHLWYLDVPLGLLGSMGRNYTKTILGLHSEFLYTLLNTKIAPEHRKTSPWVWVQLFRRRTHFTMMSQSHSVSLALRWRRANLHMWVSWLSLVTWPVAWLQSCNHSGGNLLLKPYASKYLVSRYLDPQTPPDKAFRGPKHLLTRYLEDFGRLGKRKVVFQTSIFRGEPLVSGSVCLLWVATVGQINRRADRRWLLIISKSTQSNTFAGHATFLHIVHAIASF